MQDPKLMPARRLFAVVTATTVTEISLIVSGNSLFFVRNSLLR
jgi:hypothetical protein